MQVSTKYIYENEKGIINKIEVKTIYKSELDKKSVIRIYDKQREFEEEFEALMTKYNLKLKLPF